MVDGVVIDGDDVVINELIVGVIDVFNSTARRNVSSNGFTCCKSSNNPTSSQFRIKRVGVGV